MGPGHTDMSPVSAAPQGEKRWPMAITLMGAMALPFLLPSKFSLGPQWISTIRSRPRRKVRFRNDGLPRLHLLTIQSITRSLLVPLIILSALSIEVHRSKKVSYRVY